MLSVGGRPWWRRLRWGMFTRCSPGSEGKASAQRIKVSMAATALHQCVQSLHMKMSVSRLLLRPNLDQREPHAGGEGRGETGAVWGARGVVHEMEVCAMRWTNLCMHGNVNNNKWGNLSICFCLLTSRTSIPNGSCWLVMWLPAGPNEVVSFPGHQNGTFTVQAQRDWCSRDVNLLFMLWFYSIFVSWISLTHGK